MKLARSQLTVLLNALYETGTDSISVSHPGETVGELVRIELGDPESTSIKFSHDRESYTEARRDVEREFGSPAVDELPDPQSYVNAFLAGGLIEPANAGEIVDFLDRYGSPDLSAGHKPVVAGFDTNLLAWRIASVLGLDPGQEGIVNGYALATGVRDELDWDHKRTDTRPLEDAFGKPFERIWNQPAGANREGRLGENYYRLLRDSRYADEVVTDRGDEAIVEGYDTYQTDNRKDVLLFSNDRNFVERTRSHRVLGQHVELPNDVPRSTTGSWLELIDVLYVLTVLFGVLELPKVTLYGVWKGKQGQDWSDEMLEVDCRSPKVRNVLERDNAIIAEW